MSIDARKHWAKACPVLRAAGCYCRQGFPCIYVQHRGQGLMFSKKPKRFEIVKHIPIALPRSEGELTQGMAILSEPCRSLSNGGTCTTALRDTLNESMKSKGARTPSRLTPAETCHGKLQKRWAS